MITDISGEDRFVRKTSAGHLRDRLGWDVDQPRNLAKSVTVE